MIQAPRKEIKYLLSAEMALMIQSNLEGVLHKDIHSGQDGIYTVRSQYFDSIINRDLWDNLDGMMEKRKIRTRIYGTSSDMAKLEYKCKSGSDGIKKVISITREQAIRMENGDFTFLTEKKMNLDCFCIRRWNVIYTDQNQLLSMREQRILIR